MVTLWFVLGGIEGVNWCDPDPLYASARSACKSGLEVNQKAPTGEDRVADCCSKPVRIVLT